MISDFHKIRRQYKFNSEGAKHNKKSKILFKSGNGHIKPTMLSLMNLCTSIT